MRTGIPGSRSLGGCRCVPTALRSQGTKYIITLTDRTEERRAAQALQDALVSAQNANNAKKDFLSRMSHEIRTPMNAIIGMATIAAASVGDRHRVEDCLEKIGYSSKHLLMLINDVLDMSRIESNRVKLNREPFELYQFLNNLVSVVYPQASGKGLKFTEKPAALRSIPLIWGFPPPEPDPAESDLQRDKIYPAGRVGQPGGYAPAVPRPGKLDPLCRVGYRDRHG